MLREYYIGLGLITPDVPCSWVSSHTTLALDEAGREAAARHIEEYETAKYMGYECEVPLDQVPEYVIERWESLGL